VESDERPADEGGRPDNQERAIERSAGGVVVRTFDEGVKVLLIRDPYRKWGLPKGHLEDGEGTEEAALREVREETGLADLSLSGDLGEIDWTFRKAGRLVHKFCQFYLMKSTQGEARPDTSEGITECRWLSVEEALELISYDNARGVLQRGVGHMSGPTDPTSSATRIG
jgi:8-oxo-dGTP pyrophosphatase MutT (NUDIX family)